MPSRSLGCKNKQGPFQNRCGSRTDLKSQSLPRIRLRPRVIRETHMAYCRNQRGNHIALIKQPPRRPLVKVNFRQSID